jgi:autotransporter-associated beta strand protein
VEASLTAYDGYSSTNYTAGNLQGQNPTISGFSGAWSGGGSVIRWGNSTYALNYYGIDSNDTGGVIGGVTSGSRTERNFTTAIGDNNSTHYISLMMENSVVDSRYRSFELNGFGSRNLQVGANGDFGDSGANWGMRAIDNNSYRVLSNVAAVAGETVFAVIKLTFSTTANSDSVRLWINPTDLNSESLSTNYVELTGFNFSSNRMTKMSYAAFNTASLSQWDEFRLGTTWDAVTPAPASLTVNAGETYDTGTSNTNNGTVFLLGGNITGTTGIVHGRNFDLQSGNASAILGGYSAVKTTSGTVTLSGANTFNTGLRIEAGQVNLNNSSAAGNGTITILGGTLDNTSGGAITLSKNNAQSWSGDFSFVGTNNLNLGTGNVTMNATRTLTISSGTLTVGGAISGTGFGLTKNGSGTLQLSGANTYTGATSVNAGNLTLSGSLTGSSITVNGASAVLHQTAAGSISGTGSAFTLTAGSASLSGNNSYTGGTAINGGTLTIGHAGALGASGNISFDGGTLQYGSGITADLSSRIKNSASAIAIDTNGQAVTYGSAIDSTNSGGLVKSGAGSLTLSAANTYTGATTVNGGTLVLNGSNTGSAITVNSGGTLGGTGTGGALTVNSGGTVAPGTSPGTLTVESAIWNGGGNYNWQIHNATGAAGTGWDLLSSAGTLTIGATSGDKFKINLWSLSSTAPDTTGTPVNFNAASNYSWSIASFSSISGFSADKFQVVSAPANGAGGFLGATGTFSISSNGTVISIDYTAPSASAVWTAGSGNWSTGANWQSGSVPSPGVPIEFAGGGGTSTNNSALASVNGLSFTANATGSYTVNGSTLEVGAGGIDNLSSHSQTVAMDLTLSDVQTFSATGADLTISGAVDKGSSSLFVAGSNTVSLQGVVSAAGALSKTGSGTLVLSANNTYSGTTTVSAGTLQIGIGGTAGSLNPLGSLVNNDTLVFNRSNTATQGTDFSSSAISGTGVLVKNGSGTLVLNAANTYSGGTTLNAGTILIAAANALGTSGNVTFAGGTLQYGSGITTDLSARIKNSASAIAINTNGQAVTYGSAIDSTNSGGLVKSGAGSLTLSAVNTYTGATTINAGTLALSGGSAIVDSGTVTLANTAGAQLHVNGNETIASLQGGGTSGGNVVIASGQTLTVAETGSITFSGAISGDGGLAKSGSGTLTLDGTNIYTGTTTVNAGTLALSGGNAIADTATVTLANTAGVQLHVNASETIASLQGGGGTGGNVSIASGQTLTVAETGSITFAGVVSGAGSLAKSGAGNLTLTGTNTNTGGITVAGGRLLAGSNANLGATSTALTLDGGTFVMTTAFNTSRAVALGSSGGTLDTNAADNSTAVTLSGDISGNGPLTFAANGQLNAVSAGRLELTGNNSFTGTITITSGIVAPNSANAFGNASNTIVLNGGGLLANSGITVVSNNIVLGASGGSFRVWGGGPSLTINASIGGNGSLEITDNGPATLNRANTYTGDTRIKSSGPYTTATLNLGHVDALAGSTLDINAADRGVLNLTAAGNNTYNIGGLKGSGNLTSNGSNTISLGGNDQSTTYSGTINGTGGLAKAGNGTLTLTGSNTFTGGTTVNSGTLILANANAPGSGTITQSNGSSLLVFDTTGTISNAMSIYNVQASQTITLSGGITVNNATFDVDAGDTLTISGGIGGTGGVTKNGEGTLSLSGSNSYSGATVVNAGTLNAANANALGTNASVTVNGGSLLVGADDAIDGKNITLASTSTTVAGLAFSGTYNGTAGSLTLSQNSILDLGTGSVVLHFSGIAGLDTYTLAVYNWTGTTLWNGGTGGGTDQFYSDGAALTQSQLNNISFYSGGLGTSSFLGSGYQILGGSFNKEIIAVPEPETYATAALLLLGCAAWMWRKGRAKELPKHLGCSRGNARNPAAAVLFMGMGDRGGSF